MRADVPDQSEGLQDNLLQAFPSTVRNEDTFCNGCGEPSLVPLLNLSRGLPTSRPASDPSSRSFVYQRLER